MAAANTIRNLAVGRESRCIIQGFTGKMSTFHSKLSLGMGTNIVGGVSPGKGGQTHLERPVFGSVKEAVREVKLHATAVFVPALLAADAIIDAIENEIPLIVSVAEGIPLQDQMRVMAALHSQSKSRVIGANSPGMSNPAGCRLGISPVNVAKPGPIGECSLGEGRGYSLYADHDSLPNQALHLDQEHCRTRRVIAQSQWDNHTSLVLVVISIQAHELPRL